MQPNVRLLIFFLIGVCFIIGCKGSSKKQLPPNPGSFSGYIPPVVTPNFPPPRVYGHTPPTPPPPPNTGTTTGANTGTTTIVANGGEHVHVFKYSGRRVCEIDGIDLAQMEALFFRLGIKVHDRYQSKDGKDHSEDCGSLTGEINVYVISRSNVPLSERTGGFCECILDNAKSICVPYQYQSPPSSGCM